ncbi:uncharacterized protein LOC111369121 [Olea europaea var. sylvestris]|uniref:uncharacterized protein LOC111369121 n=1 Tax=Olea europaea var. sylvestris TaxID=158386 RepID=UPI000C1D792F|nr:uncharacterized protein LOC111369121 [Olea europaea var. sylvestris]
MILSEPFKFIAIIEKLSKKWKDFKNYLKHKCREMKLEDLIVRLRIKEVNQNSKKKFGKLQLKAKINLMEPNTSKRMKHSNNSMQKSNVKKFKRDCYNYGKPSHTAEDCRQKMQNKKDQPHLTKEDKLSNDVSELMISVIVYENMVDNSREWFVDTGATNHIVLIMRCFHLTLLSMEDDCTWVQLYLFAKKQRRCLTSIKQYKNEVENQLSKQIKVVRGNRGGEYGALFEDFCLDSEIIHQITAPYLP